MEFDLYKYYCSMLTMHYYRSYRTIIVQALLNIPENLAMKVVMDSCESGDQCERELTK